jgi:hypothetical protein
VSVLGISAAEADGNDEDDEDEEDVDDATARKLTVTTILVSCIDSLFMLGLAVVFMSPLVR